MCFKDVTLQSAFRGVLQSAERQGITGKYPEFTTFPHFVLPYLIPNLFYNVVTRLVYMTCVTSMCHDKSRGHNSSSFFFLFYINVVAWLVYEGERWGAGVEYHFQEFNEPYAPS